MGTFSIKTNSLKEQITVLADASGKLRESVKQIEEIRASMDPSFNMIVPILEDLARRGNEHALKVQALGEALGAVVQEYTNCEYNILASMANNGTGASYYQLPNASANTACVTGNVNSQELEKLKKEYGLTDEEFEYLKNMYPGLLFSLYGTDKYSNADAWKVMNQIREKLPEKIYDPETIHNYRGLLKDLGWSESALSDKNIIELLNAMEKHNIDTKEKKCAFLAEVSYESGCGKSVIEQGSDEYFRAMSYDKEYRGGGYIQLTHYYGYQAFATYEILLNHPELQGYAKYYSPAHFGPDTISREYEKLVTAASENGIDISRYTRIYDEGAEYVAENFAWESAAYFWDNCGCNQVVENGGSINDVSAVVNHDDINTFEERKRYYENLCSNYSRYFG